MIPFDTELLEQLKEYDGQRVVIYVTLDNGAEKKFFGKFKISSQTNTLLLFNDSKEYEPLEGWDSDFKIQFLKPSPFLTLMNWEKYNSGDFMGKLVDHDQFSVQGFKIYN